MQCPVSKLFVMLPVWVYFSVLAISAAELPAVPNPFRFVNDYGEVLSEARESLLEDKLTTLQWETSAHLVVVTVPELDGQSAYEYGARLMEQWGVGNGAMGYGVVLVLHPRTRGGDRGEAAIVVGPGLTATVPQAATERILEKTISNTFRSGTYGEGVDEATDVLVSMIRDEYTAETYLQKTEGRLGSTLLTILFLLVVFVLLYRGSSRRIGNPRRLHAPGDLSIWMALSLVRNQPGAFEAFRKSGSGISTGGGGSSGSW